MKTLWKANLFIILHFIMSCSFSYKQIELRKAEQKFEDKEYKKSLKHYLNLIYEYSDKPIAQKAAKKCITLATHYLNDIEIAISCLDFLITTTHNRKEKLEFQIKKSMLYFETLSYYEKAIDEFQKALVLSDQINEHSNNKIRFRLAQSYFQLKNYYQAEIELQKALTGKLNENEQFRVQFFLGQILTARKAYSKAEEIFNSLLKKFSLHKDYSEVQLALIQVLEEKREIKKAITFIDSIINGHPKRDWLELKKTRLEKRLQSEPGAGGLSK